MYYREIKLKKNLIFILFISIIGCKEKTHHDYYKNGSIKEKQIIIDKKNSSDKEFIIMRYNEDGCLIDSFYTINGEINGIRKTFNSKDSVVEFTEYRKNILNGNMIAYFQNGKVRYQGKIENGKRIGTWLYYYKNGNISAFQNFPLPDSSMFYRKYYEDGKIAQTKGSAIVMINMKKDIVKLNETFEAYVYPVFPPNCKVEIHTNFAEKSPKSKKLERINFDGHSHIILRKPMKEKGVLDWRLNWEIYDTLRDDKYKGFTYLRVIVK